MCGYLCFVVYVFHFSFSCIIFTAIIQSYMWISVFGGLYFSLLFQLYDINCNNTILYVDIYVCWLIFSLFIQLYDINCNNTILYVNIYTGWFIFFTSLSVVLY